MRAFLSISTAALLAIHTVFGCCWHHAHACEHDLSFTATHPAGCCDHHSDGGNRDEQAPGQEKADCEGVCTYVAPQKVRIDGPTSCVSLDAVAIPMTVQHCPPSATHASALWWSPSELAPPLRKHSLHQVLLI